MGEFPQAELPADSWHDVHCRLAHNSYISEFNKPIYGEKLSAVMRLVGRTCAPTSSAQAEFSLGLAWQPGQEFSQGCTFNL